jgi:hypothetical protein
VFAPGPGATVILSPFLVFCHEKMSDADGISALTSFAPHSIKIVRLQHETVDIPPFREQCVMGQFLAPRWHQAVLLIITAK